MPTGPSRQGGILQTDLLQRLDACLDLQLASSCPWSQHLSVLYVKCLLVGEVSHQATVWSKQKVECMALQRNAVLNWRLG